MMAQPAATAAPAAVPPLPTGVQEEEGEFVDVDLGGGQHQPAAPVPRDAAQQQPASACPARGFCVAAADVLFGCLLSCLLDSPRNRKGVKNQ